MRRKWRNNSKSHPKTYQAWNQARARCYLTTNKDYPYYGARGITVCERWKNDYDAFVEDMGFAPEGYSIERKDNNLGYCPENCLWIPKNKQSENRRNSRFVTHAGKTYTLARWSRELGVHENTLYFRMNKKGKIMEYDL